MKNVRFVEYEAVPRPIVAIGNEFASGHQMPPHRHRRSQLVYADVGVLSVGTEHGRWVVPPHRAVWIPGGILHELSMFSHAETITIWLEGDQVTGMPESCRVVDVSPLVHQLLHEAAKLPSDYDPTGRDGLLVSFLLAEMRNLAALPFCLPFPRDPRLSHYCQAFLKEPVSHDTIDHWCSALGMSRRTFTRLFLRETGMSFLAWRQQACVFAALPRLARRESITSIALDMGYGSPPAFTTMFKRILGVSPRDYLDGLAQAPYASRN